MKQPLHLAHISDIHLDTDYFADGGNVATRDQYRAVFDRLLERVAALAPDLVLLPGDLFDSNRASDETIQWAMARLEALGLPVLMIPGNHDCLTEGAIFHRYDFNAVPNVTLLMDEAGASTALPELGVHAWGKGMVDHRPEFRPLVDMAAPQEAAWNLGLGHGIYVGGDPFSYRSSPVKPEDIAGSGYDYIALGHHHALLHVGQGATEAYYCGAPVPISADDAGTFLSVRLEAGAAPQVTVHELD